MVSYCAHEVNENVTEEQEKGRKIHSVLPNSILCGNARCGFIGCGDSRGSFTKPEADGDGVIDLLHKYVVNMSHLFAQTRLIDGADLLEQNDGILDEPEALCVNVDMRRQFGFAETARDGGSDHGGTVFISDIILDDQDGTESALLAADDGTQVCVINISAFDNQFGSLFLF